jgi:hypothetical protein
MGELIGGILVLAVLSGMIYLAFFFSPETTQDKNVDINKHSLNNTAGTKALKYAIENATLSMNYVTARFREFDELRKADESKFVINFIWLEIAVIITRAKINKGVDETEFANQIFKGGLISSEEGMNQIAVFVNGQRDEFFGGVNAYLSAIAKFIESGRSSEIDPGPGWLLIRHLMNSAKGKDNLTDEDINKCLIVGSELSTSLLEYIFEEHKTTSDKVAPQPVEDLSQRLDDAAEKCGCSLQEFLNTYQSYLATLKAGGSLGDDIDLNALKFNILTADEIEKGKSNINQAALNRTIYSYEYLKALSLQ